MNIIISLCYDALFHFDNQNKFKYLEELLNIVKSEGRGVGHDDNLSFPVGEFTMVPSPIATLVEELGSLDLDASGRAHCGAN